MRRFSILSLMICLATVTAGWGEPPLTHVDVFLSGKDGYFAYRIPAMETCPDGSLLAFAEGRRHNLSDPGGKGQEIHLVLKRSIDGGATWSPMKVIEDSGQFWSSGNPATVVDRQNGRVWVFYLRCKPGRGTNEARPGTDDAANLARYSDDNGVTWSEPVDQTQIARDVADARWRISVPGPGGAIQDHKGRLIVPMWRFAPWGAFAMFSEDHGRTWHRGAQVPGEQEGDEDQLVELSDGRILLDIRQHDGPHRWMAASTDGGRTWSEPRPGQAVTAVCCAIKRYALRSAGDDRDRLLWTGPRGPGRNRLAVRTSYDEGETFTQERLISSEPAAYSDLTVLKDKSVGVLWERGGYRSITFTRLSREFLEPAQKGESMAPCERLVDAPPGGAHVWPSQPPKDCPFPPSKQLGGIFFTGRRSDYHCGDTWYPSWASDGNQYSPWTDGATEGVRSNSGGEKAVTGSAVMIGEDPLRLVIRNTAPPQPASPRPYEGRYPCGSLVYNGVWYYGTYCLGPAGSVMHEGFRYNWPVLGPMPGFRISRDYGRTWTPSPLSPDKPLFPEPKKFMCPVKMGCPHFVDFGRNMEHSPDGKAYLVGMGAEEDDPKPRYANLSWITADQVYLARVTPGIATINDVTKYEFYAGHDAAGKAHWSPDFSQIKPLLDWNNNMGCVTVTYDAPLKKYLMCVTDGWPTVAKMNSYVLEADAITGPWRLVVYMKDFGEQGYFLNFPSKFIGKDGKTLWLCYSANFSPGWNNVRLKFNPPGGRYGLCLHEIRLLGPGEKPAEVPSPLEGLDNVAPQAKAEASSTYPGYSARGAIDRKVGGYPENTEEEWASKGEAKGAWLKLTWGQPQRIRRIWLFDRPNSLDQVTGARLEFSDGTSLPLETPLPDNALRGVEITFEPKTITWLKFTVTDAKPGSPNIGLSEIAVFR